MQLGGGLSVLSCMYCINKKTVPSSANASFLLTFIQSFNHNAIACTRQSTACRSFFCIYAMSEPTLKYKEPFIELSSIVSNSQHTLMSSTCSWIRPIFTIFKGPLGLLKMCTQESPWDSRRVCRTPSTCSVPRRGTGGGAGGLAGSDACRGMKQVESIFSTGYCGIFHKMW